MRENRKRQSVSKFVCAFVRNIKRSYLKRYILAQEFTLPDIDLKYYYFEQIVLNDYVSHCIIKVVFNKSAQHFLKDCKK